MNARVGCLYSVMPGNQGHLKDVIENNIKVMLQSSIYNKYFLEEDYTSAI